MTKKNKIVWLDCLRIAGCFAVVLAHSAMLTFAERVPFSFDWHVCNMYYALFHWPNYIFFMISGVFFLNPEIEIPVSKLYKKYIKKLALVFLFWFPLNSLFFCWYGNEVFSPDVFASGNIFVILKKFILFTPLHLWFLLAIIAFYISVPLLRCITRDKNVLPYCIFVGVLAAFVRHIEILSFVIFTCYLMSTCLPFVLGYYLTRCAKISRKTEFALYALGIAGYLTMVLPTAYLSYRGGNKILEYFDESKLAMAVAVFVFFKCHVSKINFSHHAKSVIEFLSSHTLGIYLLQTPLLCIVHKYILSINSFNPLFSIPVVAIITFVISLAVTMLLKQIPWFNRYFI